MSIQPSSGFDSDYLEFFHQLKTHIKSTQIKVALSLNKEVIQLYFQIGQQIIKQQKHASWGRQFLTQLSADLRHAFPEMRGFSTTNLKYMRILAYLYPDGIGQQPVDQLPWGHITLIIRLKNSDERHWYLQSCVEHGWSRATLEKQIRSSLYQRQKLEGHKASNFLDKLQPPQSFLTQEILKNPYNFDFLCLHDDAHEREIEYASVQHITKFLLELGKGFAFIGHQVPLEVSDQEFFIDMLFYNTSLHCYVVVEIKAVPFKPEHTGQLNFYLSAVDDKFKTKQDNASIGILLCKSRDKIVAEYALRDIDKPIGISEYHLTKSIPQHLQTSLPTIQEIEAQLNVLGQEKKEGILNV